MHYSKQICDCKITTIFQYGKTFLHLATSTPIIHGFLTQIGREGVYVKFAKPFAKLYKENAPFLHSERTFFKNA